MSTSCLARPILTVLACALLASCATPGLASKSVDPAVELHSGQHLKVVSAYLRASPQAVVRGFVRRDPLWRGRVDGHLHVVAYGHDGRVVAQRPATWSGGFTSSHAAAAIYQADLAVPRDVVARLAVSVAPGRHTASESFQ
jgi:hypothetical protein